MVKKKCQYGVIPSEFPVKSPLPPTPNMRGMDMLLTMCMCLKMFVLLKKFHESENIIQTNDKDVSP